MYKLPKLLKRKCKNGKQHIHWVRKKQPYNTKNEMNKQNLSMRTPSNLPVELKSKNE